MANGKRTDATRIAARERRIKALELRKAAVSYRAIGDTLGVSEAQAHRDVQEALAALVEQERSSAEELRQLELERLDMAALAIVPQVRKGGLAAVAQWVRLSESRRKLLGLDAPTKVASTTPDGTALAPAWVELRTVVLHALAPYPEARAALALTLDEVPDAADDTP
jgi:hypothetical protein